MTEDNWFGPDRDDEPGITPKPGITPPNIVEFQVESCAIHSRSRGWLPGVVIRMATIDGVAMGGTMEVTDQLREMAENMLTAGTRAIVDVQVGIANGTLT